MIVNTSPWGGTRALTAWRFLRAWQEAGQGGATVFFRGEGVYNALDSAMADAGTEALAGAWTRLAENSDTHLLLCSAAAGRRLPADGAGRAAAES